jgi:cation diffusion facilitator CzcD-associated flavoprotein CzcO
MAGLGDSDGYQGTAVLEVGEARFDVRVRLRGHFQPIDGRYHWYGRIDPHDGLAEVLGPGNGSGVLTTPEGSARCELSEPDPSRRYRVTGISTPPFAAQAASPEPAPAAPGPAGQGPAGEGPAGEGPAGQGPAGQGPAGLGSAIPAPAAPDEAGVRPGTAPEPAHQAGPAPASAAPLPGHVRVAVIGTGFGGLGVAIALQKAGHRDFVLLERAAAVGGTWRDNSYPGCTCDVPSHLYSFSFAPNPDWTRSFSRQPEIWDYLERVTDRYGLRRKIRFGVAVTEARWDTGEARWRIGTSRGAMTADVLISAAGPLSEPRIPDIPGLDSFPGPVFHSAEWDHDFDLTGKRVAVVGTGASAIQIVPEIQPKAGRLVLFQRTPAWVMPRRDRRISEREKRLYRHVPLAQRAARLGLYVSREALVGAFVKRPQLLRSAQRLALANMAKSIGDPALRAKLTPDYVMGCKRILLSNDYYPALAQPNVDVVASGLAKVDGNVLTAQDGTSYEVDAIAFATGFRATDMPIAKHIYGAAGLSLAEAWQGDMRALRGTTVPGFPNLCLVVGPNTGLGHNSIVHIIESQLSYITDYLATLERTGAAALDARPGAEQRWCAEIERRMAATVWTTGGCVSWYLNAAGRNPTLWPASTIRFRWATRRLDPAEYDLIPAPAGA